MTDAAREFPVEVEPAYASTGHGELFLLNVRPRAVQPDRYVLIVPPFAEEMNKCRRMSTLLSRSLAARGVGVLSVDLSGTGESWGDFGDARYDLWLADLKAARDWIEDRGAALTGLIGIRFGALLAAEFAGECATCEKLMFWQPAANGRTILSQFLRLRVAADMMSKNGANVSVAALTESLQQGQHVEAAGYEISSQLYETVSELRLSALLQDCRQEIFWFQVSMLGDDNISPADRRIIDELEERGIRIHGQPIRGETFWNTAEITTCEPLIEATLEKFLSR